MKKINVKPYIFIILIALGLNVTLVLSSFFLIAWENTSSKMSFQKDFVSFYLKPYHDLPADKKEQFLQQKSNTCGPAALSYLFNMYGLMVDEDQIAQLANTNSQGTSLKDLIDCAKKYGFKAWGEQQNLQGLIECPKPVIAHINNSHFVTVEKISETNIILFDPLFGRMRMSLQMFESIWSGYVAIIDVPEPVHNQAQQK